MREMWSRRQFAGLGSLAIAAVTMHFRPAGAGQTSVATPVASPAASPVASAVATPIRSGGPVSVTDHVTIELTDQGYVPDYVQSTNGHELRVTLRNTGSREHGFRILALGVDVTVMPGDEKRVTIETPPLGDFTFTSGAPGDEHFRGILVFYI